MAGAGAGLGEGAEVEGVGDALAVEGAEGAGILGAGEQGAVAVIGDLIDVAAMAIAGPEVVTVGDGVEDGHEERVVGKGVHGLDVG